MDRRAFLRNSVGSIALGGAAGIACSRPSDRSSSLAHASDAARFELEEATIQQLQDWMASGKYTARSLTDLYLERIEATNRKGPGLGAVIETNPEAADIADRLDAERQAKMRGRLHGIPILIEDSVGPPRSESTLVTLSKAVEHATHARKPPRFLPTADLNA